MGLMGFDGARMVGGGESTIGLSFGESNGDGVTKANLDDGKRSMSDRRRHC